MMGLSTKNYLYCIQKKNPYLLCPFHTSILSMTTTIMMVKNNQVQVCDDALRMFVDGIYSTAGDVDYGSFYIVLKSNYYGCDDAHGLAFDTKHKTARNYNHHTTYKVYQSLFL